MVKNVHVAEKKAELTPQSTFRSSLLWSRQRKNWAKIRKSLSRRVKSLVSTHRSAEPSKGDPASKT